MLTNGKYPRTYHAAFSEGATSDDRINSNWYQDVTNIKELVFLEKMDGENTTLSEHGVFARSHAAPSDKPWTAYLRQKHSLMVHDLKKDQVEIFGESLFATHSILYPKIEEHFYVFAVRHLDKWLSWEEVEWWASVFDLKTVPVISRRPVSDFTESTLKGYVQQEGAKPSAFGSYDLSDDAPCTMEGVVFRNTGDYHVDAFVQNLFKMVRKGHVKTDDHWEKHWSRAYLKHEVEAYSNKHGILLSDPSSYMEVIRKLGHKR